MPDMKNKHLLLLFLGVLILGLMSRHLPWNYRSFFKNELIRIDTSSLIQCAVLVSGQPELSLDRTETGWVAVQLNRSTPLADTQILPLLSVLSDIHILRTLKSSGVDTMGLSESMRLCVTLQLKNRRQEQFWLGNETLENGAPATYLQMPRHEGLYLVPGHLRRVFSKNLDDFRSDNILSPLDSVLEIGLQWADELPVFFERNDSTGRWESTNGLLSCSGDSVQNWLLLFKRLQKIPFADNFDESRASETHQATIFLVLQNRSTLRLRIFYDKPPDIPEDLTALRARGYRNLPAYILNSSFNPVNFFAIEDTGLVRQICYGLLPPK